MTLSVHRAIPSVAFAALLFALPAAPANAEQTFDEGQVKAIEKIVRDYLVDHPEAVAKAIEELRRRDRAEEDRRRLRALSAHNGALRGDPDSFVGGNPEGDVTIVEFFDYNCPYCKRALPVIKALLKRDRDIRLVYKEFPILGPASLYASRAAIASLEQGDKYGGFHDALMATRGTLSESRVMRIAAEQGLDTEKLKKDMTAPRVETVIRRNRRIASALRISGTPSFVIGDTVVPGFAGLERLSMLISEARNGCMTC